MLGLCPHNFLWPRRAADGDYYQVCRLCGAEYKYDWRNMRRKRRMERTNVKPGPPSAPASVSSNSGHGAAPRLKLLLELEPAHRVFFRNLADFLFFRRTPPVATTSGHAPFWPDVFVHSVMPWRRFSESLLYHTIALAAVFILSQPWARPVEPVRRSVFRNSHLSYYKPSQTFPALRGSQSLARPPAGKRRQTARQAAMKVAPERAAGSISAPDLKLNGPARPNVVASNVVAPAMPLAAVRGRLTVPAGPTSVVAPPPDVYQSRSMRSGLPQASGVAPAPQVGSMGSRPGMAAPSAIIVAPAPTVQGAMRRLGDVNIGPAAVVAPSPRLPMGEQSLNPGVARAGLGSAIGLAVPPPPSAPGSGTLAGRMGSLSSGGLQAVPPPPSVHEEVSNSGGGGLLSSLFGAGSQAVPPAPSIENAGHDAGSSGAGRGAGALSRMGSGAGVQGVPPAPSVGGGTAGNGGREGRRQVAMNMPPALAPAAPPVIDNAKQRVAEEAREPATEEMPLRLIGLAMALPKSSFFSNYEVFIAERRLRKDQSQLIKLVYVSLPYQRRLSEYGVDNSKVYKLRVSRDRTCDESLLQMTWPETDPRPDAHNSADAPALSADDRKSMLPCYRTTADDYRRAISRSR